MGRKRKGGTYMDRAVLWCLTEHIIDAGTDLALALVVQVGLFIFFCIFFVYFC